MLWSWSKLVYKVVFRLTLDESKEIKPPWYHNNSKLDNQILSPGIAVSEIKETYIFENMDSGSKLPWFIVALGGSSALGFSSTKWG